MEIGLANEEKGISYFELVKQVEAQLNYKFGVQSELTFLVWFSENFRRSNNKLTASDINDYRWYQKQRDGIKFVDSYLTNAKSIEEKLKFKYWLNGTASKQYTDYKEYRATRKSSKLASIFATVSIIIAIISFWYGYQAQNEVPKPPFEVKIIEDKTSVKDLENKIEQIQADFKEQSEQLYKAEMLISVYESENKK